MSANKDKESTYGLAVSLTVLQVHIELAQGASSRGTGCEMWQAQDQESVARVEPEWVTVPHLDLWLVRVLVQDPE